MSVEQVARDFVSNMMVDQDKAKGAITADAVASGGALPQPMPLIEALSVSKALKVAFPDFHIDFQHVTVNRNQVTVQVMWGGTQTGPFALPGGPTIPPTGKKVSVKDAYVVTLRGDKVSHFEITSPADGGIPAALAQLGVPMPSM